MKAPRTILITGASSGLGAALARGYAASEVTLALTGRNRERLDAVTEACRLQGARVESRTLDVGEAGTLDDWIRAVDDTTPIDLAIANAGVSAGTGRDEEDRAQYERLMATNVTGCANTVWPVLERMLERQRGQIAIMSSLASFRGFPGAPAYCASKAAVRVWGEALRGYVSTFGIEVSVICPGYVRTPMTANNPFPMPLLVEADDAAEIIRRGLARNKGRIVFPWRLYAGVWLLAALPPGWTDRLLQRLPRKS